MCDKKVEPEKDPNHIVSLIEEAYQAGWKGVGLGPKNWGDFVEYMQSKDPSFKDDGIADYKGMAVKRTPWH